jgi:hypothetical protein
MMIFAFFDDDNIASLNRIFDPVNREHALALDEDKHFIHIVDMARLGVSDFTGLENIQPTAGDTGIAKKARQQVHAIRLDIGDSQLLHILLLYIALVQRVQIQPESRIQAELDVFDYFLCGTHAHQG